jgi:hypothetical protein
MFKETLQAIYHVEIYALIGFIIFFTFFIFVAIHAIRMGKDEVTRLSNMPLDDQDIEQAKE